VQHPTAESPRLQVLVWLASAVVAGVAGLFVVGATYREFMDCSNPELHESANTTFGWTVAVVASALPVAVATWLAGGPWRKLPALAFAIALLSLAVWWWMLDADCEWYALSRV
jgi:hypothetical protein